MYACEATVADRRGEFWRTEEYSVCVWQSWNVTLKSINLEILSTFFSVFNLLNYDLIWDIFREKLLEGLILLEAAALPFSMKLPLNSD